MMSVCLYVCLSVCHAQYSKLGVEFPRTEISWELFLCYKVRVYSIFRLYESTVYLNFVVL